MSDRILEQMVTDYAKKQMTKDEFVAAYNLQITDESFCKQLCTEKGDI